MKQNLTNIRQSKTLKLGDIISAIRTAKGDAVEIAKVINKLKHPENNGRKELFRGEQGKVCR